MGKITNPRRNTLQNGFFPLRCPSTPAKCKD
jgi:hypothetical protein